MKKGQTDMGIKNRAKLEKAAVERIKASWHEELITNLHEALQSQMPKGHNLSLSTPEIHSILEKAKVAAVAQALQGLRAEYSDFYHNKPNDYGSIQATLYTGEGDPSEKYCGMAVLGLYADGQIKETGTYTPSGKLAKKLLKQSYATVANQEVLTQALKEKQAQKKAA